MGKLHELLAVEADRKKTAEAILEETKVTFTKRTEHFTELRKEYKPDNENEKQLDQPAEVKAMVETVKGKLEYMAESQAAYMDVVYQKELANCDAHADLALEDGSLIEGAVPATVLLGLETKLKALREAYMVIPTLPPGEDWERDDDGNYVVVEKKIRTKKVIKNHVKAPATDKHPAQVDVYTEDDRIGLAVTVKTTSVMSPGDKSGVLSRLDELLRAVKTARQRANMAIVPPVNIGKKLFSYIHEGTLEQRKTKK